jgi:tetratricopeptide (TPR) repeat protein
MNEEPIDITIQTFQAIVRKYQLFHLVFAAFGLIACLLFFIFYSTLAEAYIVAICLACFFFLAVSYFVLRLYFQEQKPRKLHTLCEWYRNVAKKTSPATVGEKLQEVAAKLDDPPATLLPFFAPLDPILKKILYINDLMAMKELFLLSSVDEYLALIKKDPTSFSAHANLAKAYGLLGALYKNNKGYEAEFKQSSMRAIEELEILKEYKPDTLWVRRQLALHFQELNMPENEIDEYEAICALCPSDYSAFVTLGTIYFQQGKTGKGLKIYESLKEKAPEAAEELLNFYGSSCLPTHTRL